jgi:hypothetical protein
MSEKIGRNDLCTCGSGKKYKKCCLQNVVHLNIPDEEWRKLRQLEGTVIDDHLSPYATQELPTEIGKLALMDCFPADLPEQLDQEVLFNNFFIPWFLFNWIPAGEFDVKQFDPEKTVSQNYLEVHGSRLNSAEKRFIEAMNKTYYSFYSILEVELEKRLVVKDILLGTTHTVKERQGTHWLKRGDIVFGRILTLDNQSIFIGMAPYIIPTRFHHDLIDFKEWLIEEHDTQALTPESLRDSSDMELCGYFFDLLEAAYNQPFPTLANTDGELLQFMKSYFKLSIKPEEALHALLPLTLSKDAQEFLDDAKRSKSGAIQKINIPWLKKGNKKHKGWNNTVMGQITLQENRLILETNSAERNQRGKKLLTKYLGDAISFQKTLIESPEKKIKSKPASSSKDKEDINLMELPEVQEQLKAMVKAHWENWFDDSLPALNNQTPREAAKTKEGRERLEALLLQFERHNAERKDNNLLGPDINYLRKELALDN